MYYCNYDYSNSKDKLNCWVSTFSTPSPQYTEKLYSVCDSTYTTPFLALDTSKRGEAVVRIRYLFPSVTTSSAYFIIEGFITYYNNISSLCTAISYNLQSVYSYGITHSLRPYLYIQLLLYSDNHTI
jgi:hypothetical protein